VPNAAGTRCEAVCTAPKIANAAKTACEDPPKDDCIDGLQINLPDGSCSTCVLPSVPNTAADECITIVV
jgi:hypothetical protein